MPKLQKGNAAYDDGYFTFDREQYEKFINVNPDAKILFKKYVSASDILNGTNKYCLWIQEDNLKLAYSIPSVKNRIEKVKVYRENSKRSATRDASATPYKFGEIRWKQTPAIIIPVVSSESRIYIPMGYINSDIIPSYATFVIYDAPIWLLGLLESRMHMTWLRAVGGKLETRYRYSAGLVYNTFPVPNLSTRRKKEIENIVWKILDIRDEEGGTLAELYGSPLATKNPKPMNPRLLVAHRELDQVIDRAYRARPFKDDNDRLSLLLNMYDEKIREEKHDDKK